MTDTCHRCGLPILEGEARYTAGEFRNPPRFCHYECKERADKELDESFVRFRKTVDKALGIVARLKKDLEL